MNTGKKLVSLALFAMVIASFTPVAHGQTVAELQATINSLMAQIQALNAQLNAAQGTPVTGSYNFTKDLTLGSKGTEVTSLQQFLITGGYLNITAPTAYFGSMTKAALAKFQAGNGIAPAAGYFGPKTRAFVNAMGVNPGPGPVPGPEPVPAPASGLAVSLSSENPVAGSFIASSARLPVLGLNFTAGNAGGITLNDLKFKKTGVVSDSAISAAYLLEGGKVVAQYSSISGGIISFNGLGLGINAGQTRKFQLAIDPGSVTSGNTVSFALLSASDVAAVDSNNTAVTTTGTFPFNGNVFTATTVSNPSIATLTVSSGTAQTSVYAGDQNQLISQWTLAATNSPVDLKGITFKVTGSATKTDIKNVKLFVNGAQIGQTLAMVPADGVVFFDFSTVPARISTGNSNMQIYADVMGSPNFNFTFNILNSFDVWGIDTQYGVPVAVTVNGGTSSAMQVSINAGSLTTTLASNTPTGNISKGGSATPLLKFKIYAAGEPVKVQWLGFSLVFTGGTGATLNSYIKNVSLIDDAGVQVGSTINDLTTTVTCTDTVQATATTTASNCFGNSSSPINYIVPANTARVLTLRGDIQTTADFTSIVAKTVSNSSNLRGQISSATASSGSVTGSSLSLVSSALTTAKNTAIGTQTYSAGSNGVKIGSYTLTASAAEGVNLASVSILMSGNAASYQNLKLMLGTAQFGTTQSVLSASSTYAFVGQLNVPAGQTKTVDVYADLLSSASAATHSALTTLSACSGSGAVTFTSVSCTSRAGQSVVVAGQSTVQISLDSGSAPTNQVVMGSTQVPLATWLLTETTGIENIKITGLNVFQVVAATTTVPSFGNMGLYQGTTLLATAGAANTSVNSVASGSPGYYWAFPSFSTPLIVPKSGSITLTLKGDVATYDASGATDNATHVFKIATSTDTANDTIVETVIALGATSNNTSSISLSSPTGNTQTVLRTKLGVVLGASPSHTTSRVATDDAARITFTADPAGALTLNTVAITLSGNGTSNSTSTSHTTATQAALMDSVNLIDDNTNATWCSASVTATSSLKASFTLSNCTLSTAGSPKVVRIRINSNNVYQSATAGATESLSFAVQANTDVQYTTAISGGTSGISLPSISVPITTTANWTD